jgi:hypothetical protein
MEQTLHIQKTAQKIYKERAIWVGTFLGGPLAAGYLIAENFKAFNEVDKAKKTWIYAILATIAVFGGVFLIPDNVEIPNQIIPIIYTAITSYFVQYFQGQNISTHINSGGQLFGWWRTIGVGIICLAITIIPILGFALLFDNTDNPTTKTYGTLKHEITFDKNNITDSEVNKIADGFIKTTFFDEAVTKYVYAKKENSNYELSLSVIDGVANDNKALQTFIDLRTELQKLFPKNKIVFKLVVDNLDNVVKRIE